MKHTFLEGEHIYLRGLEKDDLSNSYFQWLNDQEVCKFNSHGRFPNNPERMESYLHRAYTDPTLIVFAIVLKENNEHIGNISLQNINYIDRSAEFAIIIGQKDYWGKGISKEAANLIFKHGFETLNLHRIYCGTPEDNLGMRKLAQHLGMQEEGRRKEALFKRGGYMDIVEYGLLSREFFN